MSNWRWWWRKPAVSWAQHQPGSASVQLLFMSLDFVPSCEASLQHRFLLWWFYRTCSVILVSSSLLEKQQRGKDVMIKLQRNKKHEAENLHVTVSLHLFLSACPRPVSLRFLDGHRITALWSKMETVLVFQPLCLVFVSGCVVQDEIWCSLTECLKGRWKVTAQV